AHCAWELGYEVCHKVADPVMLTGGRWVSVGASVGVAYAGPGTPAGEVLHQADEAMYRAKAGTRPVVVEADSGVRLDGGGAVDRPAARTRDMHHLLEPVAPVGAGRGVAR